MNASAYGSNIGLLIGVIFMLASLGWAVHTAWRTRGMPLTREELLVNEVAELKRQIKAQDQQINMLLSQMLEREDRIRALELRTAELEREVERYRGQAGRMGRSYSKAKGLSGQDKQALRQELLEAYTSRDAWDALLQDIDRRLDNVAIGDSLDIVASKVIEQAQASGWIVDLIKEAKKQRPKVASLQALANALLKELEV